MTRPHWLAPAGATRTPAVIVTFDTETASQRCGSDEVMTLRCWNARIRDRRERAATTNVLVDRAGETAGELAGVLELAAGIGGEAWAFAHNIGFDLAVTSTPLILSERGWATDFCSLGDEATVFVFRRGRLKLVVTDSWSWLRSPLAAAARDVGMRPARLPGDSAPLAAWHRRCAHDVEILDRLLGELLDWWDGAQLGGFGITGAACGWRSLRARVPARTVLVGSDGERTAFERRAIYSGRKEVWQVGEVKHRWVADYDLANAHLTVVANLPLPVAPVNDRRVALILDPLDPPAGLGAISEVEIECDEPCAPVKIDGDVWWPRGRFRTVLSSVELEQVRNTSARVTVLQTRWYRLGDALQGWARWCLELLDPASGDVPAVVRRVAKGWGRSVPGRFALRVSTLTAQRPATHLGWALESGRDLSTGDAIEIITFGGVERTYRRDQDGGDVAPAVLAFIEGHLRAAMAQVIATRDPARMLQCNTDGWWEVCANATETIRSWEAPPPFRVVRRAHERGVTVIGPNHVRTPSERRLSGVPRDAREDGARAFTWQDWPGLRWQLEHGRPGEYIRPRRGLVLQAHYCRRWVLDDGETVPVQTTVDRSGRTVLLPWSQTAGRCASDVLAADQVPALDVLRDELAPGARAAGVAGSVQLGRRWRA